MKEAPASIMPTVHTGKRGEVAGLFGASVVVSGDAVGLSGASVVVSGDTVGLSGASVAVSGDAVGLFGAMVALSSLGAMVGSSMGVKSMQQVSPTSPRSEAQT